MTLYYYTLYDPRIDKKSVTPSNVSFTHLSNGPVEQTSPLNTDTALSARESLTTDVKSEIKTGDFDPSLFLDFQSFDSSQTHQLQLVPSNFEHLRFFNFSPFRPPPSMHPTQDPMYQYQQQYQYPYPVITPHPNRTNQTFQGMHYPIASSPCRPRTPLRPVVYTALDIQNNLNRKKRFARGPRSDSGCFVCRLRHLKCDESKPGCIRCNMIGMSCEYPQQKKHKPEYLVDEEARRLKLHEIRSHTMGQRTC